MLREKQYRKIRVARNNFRRLTIGAFHITSLRRIIVSTISFLIFVTLTQGSANAENRGNCLMCHKMPGFGLYEEDENHNRTKRIFYIDEQEYKDSYHGRLECKACHNDINEIPHAAAKKVDCTIECHIRDPSNNSRFSHKKIALNLKNSAHGEKGKNDSDLPNCKFCHNNKPYQHSDKHLNRIKGFINVCLQCHESAEWAERFYKHINYRASMRRSSKQVVALCSQCHADSEMMGRHMLDVVVGFNDTFHGKAIKYGNTEVANCLNCHAPYQAGFSPHSIISKQDSLSPVSTNNKLQTCRQSGCHMDANEAFASNGKVHPSSYGMVTWLRPTIRNNGEGSETDFQKRVIYFINLFYKLLILAVVGGLGAHQILSLIAFRREAGKRDEQ
jgi:hypothetical protein